MTGPLTYLTFKQEIPRPPARRRWIRLGLPLVLLGLAGLGWTAGGYLAATREMPVALDVLLAIGSVLPVAVAYRRPVLAWRIALVMMFAGVINSDPAESWPWNTVQIIGTLVVIGRLAATSTSLVTIWAVSITLVPVFLYAPDANAWGAAVLIVAVAALGDIVSRRRSTRELLEEQTELNELERAKRAVLEERARIAREMHDVVAHHMSMIAVQAETAPYRVADLPESAKQELTTIAAAAREALTDMRRLLGVLRSDSQEALTTPQPGYDRITELVTTAQRSGLPVDAELPELPDLPEAVGLAAYRIVQEALANAARHAPGGPVRLRARGRPGALELRVHNELTREATAGTGHGLVGMHERVALLGGELTAGPDGQGGFQVVATIPRPRENS
ncbi:putative two-component system sensor kinase [Actinoplanes missouriensis 431]|uniref:histidine kinase n=1 Tax=Actinoplanes missouriensis (strain ATCC 14538 / DSM 43046 / CBS 188.64 / JCM 3121 / NBRC 102363 / NCIMB 12654 / NRRL B-3342 / UNCC 431) TaxID=512565 RepID=I0H1K1_ACTM4|nr:putative two-component system sensor kinase [Actinoplanes missouriensis 431]